MFRGNRYLDPFLLIAKQEAGNHPVVADRFGGADNFPVGVADIPVLVVERGVVLVVYNYSLVADGFVVFDLGQVDSQGFWCHNFRRILQSHHSEPHTRHNILWTYLNRQSFT